MIVCDEKKLLLSGRNVVITVFNTREGGCGRTRIPKIPASLAESVERYTNFRYASLLSWHPLKREIIISTQFGDKPQLHLRGA
jgi:hypothetical protein